MIASTKDRAEEVIEVYYLLLGFLDKLKNEIGRESFDRNRGIIHHSMTDILNVWRRDGKDEAVLIRDDDLLRVMTLVCRAQDIMDALLEKEGNANE